MAESERGGGEDTPRGEPQQPPREFASVPPPTSPMLDYSFTLQAIMEVQKSVAQLTTKTDRLISDVDAHGSKIDTIRNQISFVKGAMWVIGGLVVIGMALIGWYIRAMPSTPIAHP